MAAKGRPGAKSPKKTTASAKANAKAKVAKTGYAALTPAQKKAYTAAAKAVQRQQQAEAYRQRRLRAAAKATAKALQARQEAARAAVKKYAVQQSYNQAAGSHQSAVLRRADARRLYEATRVASSRQFIAKGEAIHAHTTRLQTVTTAQANAALAGVRKKAAQSAARRKVSKKTQRTSSKVTQKKASKNRPRRSVGYSAQARSAGMKAAGRVKPAQRKVVRRGRRAVTQSRNTQHTITQSKAKASAKKTPASSKKVAAPVMRAPVNDRMWITAGNDQGTANCAAVALANHLLAWTGYYLSDEQVMALHEAGGNTLLGVIKAAGWDNVRIKTSVRLDDCAPIGSLVAFETPAGPHAGLLMEDRKVVSWGELEPIDGDIEEAWWVQWRVA